MSIKIDGQSHSSGPDGARRIEPKAQPDRPAGAGNRSADADRVEVSSDAKLVAAVLDAVKESPTVRADVVERARRAVEGGTVGADAHRLADRIISSLLGD